MGMPHNQPGIVFNPSHEVIEEESANNLSLPVTYNQEDNDDGMTHSVAVLEKNEVCSPGFIARRQKSAVENFAWDPNYASDIIEMRSMSRSLFLREE